MVQESANTPTVKRLCVFLASSYGTRPAYHTALVRALGETLAKSGIEVVFGGNRLGLMGELADSVKRHGGKLVGVFPSDLEKSQSEAIYWDCDEIIRTKSLEERIDIMIKRSDALLAYPGGDGTFDEIHYVNVRRKIGLVQKPLYLYEPDNFWDGLLQLWRRSEEEGFRSQQKVPVPQIESLEQLLAILKVPPETITLALDPLEESLLRHAAEKMDRVRENGTDQELHAVDLTRAADSKIASFVNLGYQGTLYADPAAFAKARPLIKDQFKDNLRSVAGRDLAPDLPRGGVTILRTGDFLYDQNKGTALRTLKDLRQSLAQDGVARISLKLKSKNAGGPGDETAYTAEEATALLTKAGYTIRKRLRTGDQWDVLVTPKP